MNANLNVTALIEARCFAQKIAEYLAAAYWQEDIAHNRTGYLIEQAERQFAQLTDAMTAMRAGAAPSDEAA